MFSKKWNEWNSRPVINSQGAQSYLKEEEKHKTKHYLSIRWQRSRASCLQSISHGASVARGDDSRWVKEWQSWSCPQVFAFACQLGGSAPPGCVTVSCHRSEQPRHSFPLIKTPAILVVFESFLYEGQVLCLRNLTHAECHEERQWDHFYSVCCAPARESSPQAPSVRLYVFCFVFFSKKRFTTHIKLYTTHRADHWKKLQHKSHVGFVMGCECYQRRPFTFPPELIGSSWHIIVFPFLAFTSVSCTNFHHSPSPQKWWSVMPLPTHRLSFFRGVSGRSSLQR